MLPSVVFLGPEGPVVGEAALAEELSQPRRVVRSVKMQSNRDADLSFSLERIPGPGLLRVDAEPPDAEVSVDGQPARPAPYSGELLSGDHNVEVSSVGYRTVAQQITLVPGQQVSLRIALSPAGGSNAPPIVGVNSAPEGALLFLDGKLIGPTPKKARCGTAPPRGKHRRKRKRHKGAQRRRERKEDG